ncbi:MAG: hypothetical protein IKT07_10445 [Oscillospiraceae bacterium]|nr:hypothetical protein [Oscillospiraceae bacterium]
MFRSFLNRLPIPAGCVALGLTGLGTLLGAFFSPLLFLFGIPSAAIQLLVLLKLFLPGQLRTVIEDPIALSTLAGTSMAMMLTAAPMRSVLHFSGAVVLWAAGLLLHLAIMAVFSARLFRVKPGSKTVRGSWLLVYVGIAAAAISAPAFSAQVIGRILLVPAGLGMIVLLPLIYHAERTAKIPEKQQPLFCITAAPASIWLVGYLSSASHPFGNLVLILLILSQVLYVPALIRFFRTFRNSFAPSFAAFTFPFVITATALKRAAGFLGFSGSVQILITLEILVALVFCILTVWKYCRFLFSAEKAAV